MYDFRAREGYIGNHGAVGSSLAYIGATLREVSVTRDPVTPQKKTSDPNKCG